MDNYEYDIFISFKNSTETGGETPDRAVAERFYQSLESKGLRVFFSNATLCDQGTDNFVLELENALESARSILIVFSDAGYLRDGWVRKEWSTFMNLAMTDRARSIFMYSLDGTVCNLPAFLREYECFTDFERAISHISNNNSGNFASQPCGRRDFFNTYWGILGSRDPVAAVESINPGVQALANFPVYRIRQTMNSTGNICGEELQELRQLAESGNSLAAYMLAMYYRDVRHLDLALSRELRRSAHAHFLQRAENGIDGAAGAEPEISLVLWQEEPEYSGAFAMAEMMADVLDAYGISHAVQVVQQSREGDIVRADNSSRKVLAFFCEHFFDRDAAFMDWLVARKERLLLGLNAFSEELVPPPLRGCFTFDSSDTGMTRACRELLAS